MNTDLKNELPSQLSGHVAAMREIDASESDIESAQKKLDAAIAKLPMRKKSAARRWLFAAGAACAVMVIGLLPIFGDDNGVAFAQVQRHFLDFQTLAFTVEQRFSGQLQLTTHVQMNRAGDVRTDIDKGMSVIMNTRQKQVLTLMHEDREAMQFAIDVAPVANAKTTDWLREIQQYKDGARPISKTRLMDGKVAHGWTLTIKGMQTEIWADDDGIPVFMTMTGDNKVDLRFRFKFNPPTDASTFSTDIPAGYTLTPPDDD